MLTKKPDQYKIKKKVKRTKMQHSIELYHKFVAIVTGLRAIINK